VTGGNDISARMANRVKLVVYASFEGAFLAGFLPIRFLRDDHDVYEFKYCLWLGVYMGVSNAIAELVRALSTDFCELYVCSQVVISVSSW